MSRRVSVELVLEAARYLFGVRNIAAETKAAAEEFGHLGTKVDGTSRDLEELSVVIIAGKKELEGFGDHTKELGLDLELLDNRIDATKRKMALLGLEFAATGDAAAGKSFLAQRSMLSKLEALRKELEGGSDNPERRIFALLTDTAGAAAAGEKVGTSFVGGLSSAFDGMGPEVKAGLIAGLVGAVLVAAVPVGAAIAGAVTGVVGAGGIAGGIFAASKDPVVRSAAQEFGSYLSQQFFSGGSSFVEPIRDSLAILKTDVDKLDLGHVFEPAAGSMTLLAAGIGNFVTRAEPGLERALQKIGPFVSAMADGLGEVGGALGQFVDDVSRNHGAIEGLRFLFGAVDATIRILGKSFEFLSATFHDADVAFLKMVDAAIAAAKFLHLPHDDLDQLHNSLEANINSGTQAIPVINGIGDAFAGTTTKIDEQRQALLASQNAFNDWLNTALGLADANTAVAQDFADLNNNLVKGKKNWDDNTQAGRDNGTEIRKIITDLERQRQQAIATSDGSQAAIDAINRKFNDLVDQLDKAAIHAGATKAELDKMAGDYHITIITDILTAAAAAKASKNDKNLAKKGFASGGDPLANDWSWVGEQGPELVKFGPGAHVFNSGQSASMAQQWSAAPAATGSFTIQNNITMLDPMTGVKTRGILITEATSRGVSSADAAAAYP
jgi:hypothetical protein